ncbi:MAG: hypothetical protein RBR95_00800 [Ignavibacteriaceae bacterium]|jgi:hypothetical protein|nr:hypothetical protein [Ignavibacteriaceae bacterium]HPO55449.1 hypothetical protein [Ignavibacteriaceae bacterium]
MTDKFSSTKFLVMCGLVLFAAFARFIPHPPNFAPIAAMALFGGAYFSNKKLAFIVPFAALFLSDLVIGLYEGIWVVYISFALVVLIGMTLKNRIKIGNVAVASITASAAFFVITNFGVWAMGILYPKTAEGLIACYTAAIPFFHNTLLGDLFYTGVLFGVYEVVKVKFPVLAEAKNS